MTRSETPLTPFFRDQGYLVLDGGLATELEARGHDLLDPLWSAKVLLEDPDAVRAVHRDYLRAGADCIASVTYQASLPGLEARGLTGEEASACLREAVILAVVERDAFWDEPAHRTNRLRPLVAASVGPYGAYLADGSEYRGDYGLDADELREFHRERWRILAAAGADVLACETIPSVVEIQALLRLIEEGFEAPGGHTRWTWISVSCPDGAHISDGTPIREVARLCDGAPGLAALGVNCTAPEHIDALVREIRREAPLPLLVYPNAGEEYDPGSKTWRGGTGEPWWEDAPGRWWQAGAQGVGGCCRIGPGEITTIRARLASAAEDGHA